MNDELEKLRAKKLEQLQGVQQQQQEFAQKFAQLETLVKPYMSADALVRYGNLRMAHEDLCIRAMVYLAQQIQSGRIKAIDDKTFKLVLMRLQEKKRETTINFR